MSNIQCNAHPLFRNCLRFVYKAIVYFRNLKMTTNIKMSKSTEEEETSEEEGISEEEEISEDESYFHCYLMILKEWAVLLTFVFPAIVFVLQLLIWVMLSMQCKEFSSIVKKIVQNFHFYIILFTF